MSWLLIVFVEETVVVSRKPLTCQKSQQNLSQKIACNVYCLIQDFFLNPAVLSQRAGFTTTHAISAYHH
jgi:hypothetical protein